MDFCRDCKFFDRKEAVSASHDAGYCRRNSPQPLVETSNVVRAAFWPLVLHTDWCGQFEARRDDASVSVEENVKAEARKHGLRSF